MVSWLVNKLRFNLLYLFSKLPWDSGIPPPELERVVAARPPGKAIDLGCGTGTNVRYLAEHGWQVTGIDFAALAIRRARRKLRGLPATLLTGDVTRLKDLDLPGPYDLALDMGCYHSLSREGQRQYVVGLRHWMRPGGLYMLYAWQPSGPADQVGLTREEVAAAFAEGFKLVGYEQGRGRPSAWYYFERSGD